MKKTHLIGMICVAWAGVASAAVYFNNSQGDNSYVNDLNWTGARGTTGGEAVDVAGVDQAKLLTGDSETALRLWIAYNNSTTGEMTIDGGSLTLSDYFRVGYRGAGTLNMDSGTVNVTGSSADITLGYIGGSSGTINMTGGQISGNRYILLGREGTGEMTMSGGTVSATLDFGLGNQAAGSGVFTMTGGQLSARDVIVGDKGNGLMMMSGGTIDVASTFRVARQSTSTSAQFDFSGGTINATELLIGSGTKTAGMIAFSGDAEMVLDGNDTSRINGYISDGWITGANSVVYDSELDKTFVTVPEPATLGLLMATGGVMLMVRRRFLM